MDARDDAVPASYGSLDSGTSGDDSALELTSTGSRAPDVDVKLVQAKLSALMCVWALS